MTTATKDAPKKVVTGEVRASYVSIFKTRYNDLSGKEEYSMMILIPKEDRKTIEKIEGAIETAKYEKWNNKLPKNLREPLKDGDDENHIPESAEPGEESYANHYFMNVKSSTKPGIVDADLNQVIDEGSFRSGDYCKVSIQAFAYDMKGNRGVSFGLNNVQVLRKGEPLGGRSRPENDFEREERDEDDMDLQDAH